LIAGNFAGEIGLLSGGRSLVDAIAIGEVDALLIDSEQLHALLIGDAALGEKITRAIIMRRMPLVESSTGGPVLIGAARTQSPGWTYWRSVGG